MQGKVCIVTGASRGLGRHVAIKLAQRGAIVIACARAQSDLEQLANEGHGHIEPYRLDISDTDAVYRMAGDIDYMLRVVVPDIAGYDAFYKRMIESVPLKNVTSRFAMEKIKSTTALPIP